MLQYEDRQNVCKLPADGSGQELLVRTSWFEDYFSITVLQDETAYEGVMTKEKIFELSNQLGISAEEYIIQCKTALSYNGGHENFIYLINDESFLWKKIHLDMKITFGTVQLNIVPAVKALRDIIDISVHDVHYLKEKTNQLLQEKEVLKNDNKELLIRISDCINLKNDFENELYSHFLSVLNSKKKKIAQLVKQLKSNGIEVLEMGDLEVDDQESVGNEEEIKKELYECETEVESSDTDNEIEKSLETNKKSLSKSDSFDSDSDSRSTFNLPKRYKTNEKSSDVCKNVGKDDNIGITGNKPNVFKPNNCKKKFCHEKEINNFNDIEAGPSGLKLSKINNSTNENHSKKESEVISNVKKNLDSWAKRNMNDFSNESLPGRAPSSKSCIENNSHELVRENNENVSSVDDILSKLLG